jgi:hypothetical protein
MTGRSRRHQAIRPAASMQRSAPDGYPPPTCKRSQTLHRLTLASQPLWSGSRATVVSIPLKNPRMSLVARGGINSSRLW